MIITQLKAENIKRLKAISITPDGSAVVIGGNNAQGKSSTLDAILMGLGGKRAFDKEPVRQGEDQANITIELSGDYVVHRSIRADGKTELTVRHKNGDKYDRPQQLLDGLMSKISFDPLEFERLEPAKQRVLLLQVCGAGEQIEEVTRQRATLAAELTERSRDRRTLTEEIGRLPYYPEVTGKVESSEIAGQMQQASVAAAEAARVDQQILQAKSEGKALLARVEDLKQQLAFAEEKIREKGEMVKALVAARAQMVVPDLEALRNQLAQLEMINSKWQTNEHLATRRQQLVEAEQREQGVKQKIAEVEAHKTAILAAAKMPIEGLSVSEAGVVFNGVPFEQASQGERLKISTAIGLALNPELKVLLLRDGSRLDENNLRMVAEMAAAAGAQVWIERVSKGEECSVIIEDGERIK